MTHLSLFSGIGGLDLAAEWAGFRTVGQCEFADYNSCIVAGHDGTRVLYDPQNPRTEIEITKMEE